MDPGYLAPQQRKQFEDAIAVLIAKPAPDFHLSPEELKVRCAALDAGLRLGSCWSAGPDVASAERQMAVTNAQIGIAPVSLLPSLNLFGTGGWQGRRYR